MLFFTADYCDEHHENIQVLGPGFKNYGGIKHCDGTIVTVKLNKYNGDLIKLLRDVDGTGKVVVVDVATEYYAVVGEKLMNFAKQNNYNGIIINGYVRDTAQIMDVEVALYALGTCPRKYMQPVAGAVNVPVSFAGVNFVPGDYLYADVDGIIVTKQPF
jgi:regulator of ribonuclease activity A